ncbi:MAG: hypothetical protein V2A34_08095 [Lentisphaerota bacterium]
MTAEDIAAIDQSARLANQGNDGWTAMRAFYDSHPLLCATEAQADLALSEP